MTESCCEPFHEATQEGSDNEGYGYAINFWKGEYTIGLTDETVKFCPWCGDEKHPPAQN